MLLLVTYDVSTLSPAGRKRLRKVAQVCVNHGQRVQNSVFECKVDAVQRETLTRQLLALINPEEDSLRIYRLTEPTEWHVEHYGTKPSIDFDGPLIL